MTDRWGRTIDYLRISVTDRCNLRCLYCMPPQGVPLFPHARILSYDQIAAFSKLAVERGIRKIRITGGEPLVRKEVEKLVAMLASIKGIADLSLTTNGQLLQEKAPLLKAAGLHRVNVSLDTLEPLRYAHITRGGVLERTLAGIRAAQCAGLNPVKINCVVDMDTDSVCREQQEVQKEALRQFAQREGLEVRFIHCMSLKRGTFSIVEGGDGGDCIRCNRLRLTADGVLKPCLFSDLGYNIRVMGYGEALDAAVENKPQRGMHSRSGNFYAIGG